MGIFALITAALQGLASLPRLLDYFTSLQIASRIDAIEKNQLAIKESFDQLSKATDTKGISDAAHSLSTRWNNT